MEARLNILGKANDYYFLWLIIAGLSVSVEPESSEDEI